MSRKNSKDCQNQSGFTLVELVVVIAILGILAGIGYVAYGGYIKYAQKGTDIELVGEIENAVSLTVQADADVQGLGDSENPVPIGTIFLTHPDSGGSSEVYDATTSKVLDTALTNTYGSGYENSLKLRYDDWHATGKAATGFIKEDGSRYLGAQEMMNSLYHFADNVFEYIANRWDGATYENKVGKTMNFLIGCLNGGKSGTVQDILTQAGLSEGIDGANQDNMKNAAIWAIANYTSNKNNKETIINDIVTEDPLNFGAQSCFDKMKLNAKFGVSDDTVTDTVYYAINSFVSLNMAVAYLDSCYTPAEGEKSIAEEFAGIMDNKGRSATDVDAKGTVWLQQIATNVGDAQNMIREKFAEHPELERAYKTYREGGQAQKDAEAYVDIASRVHDLQDKYNTEDNLLNKDLFTGNEFVNEITKLTGESSGILITAYSDGSCAVDPVEASPMEK